MRYHTVALTSVLAYVAKVPLEPRRYRFRVVMDFTKVSSSRRVGPERGSYYVTLNLTSPKSSDWSIEQVENDRPFNKDKNYPELKKFEFNQDGSVRISIDHSRAKEYSISIESDNRREFTVEYNSAFGYGSATGQFTSNFLDVTVRDYGPTPQRDFANMVAEIHLDEVRKL